MNSKTHGGYVGLIVLLLSVLILSILYVRWMNTGIQTPYVNESLQPLTASGTAPTTRTEEYRADIDAAESIQKTIDVHSTKLQGELEI